jgi:hypothetical protein
MALFYDNGPRAFPFNLGQATDVYLMSTFTLYAYAYATLYALYATLVTLYATLYAYVYLFALCLCHRCLPLCLCSKTSVEH